MDVFKNFCGHFNAFIPFSRGILIQWQKIDAYFLQYVQKNLLFCSDFSTQFFYSFLREEVFGAFPFGNNGVFCFDSYIFKTSIKDIWLVIDNLTKSSVSDVVGYGWPTSATHALVIVLSFI